jgi:hypothetical protein
MEGGIGLIADPDCAPDPTEGKTAVDAATDRDHSWRPPTGASPRRVGQVETQQRIADLFEMLIQHPIQKVPALELAIKDPSLIIQRVGQGLR